MRDVPIDIGFNRVTVRSRIAVERADDGCSWMLTLGIVCLAAAMNQVVIELFRRGQASNGGVGGYCSKGSRRYVRHRRVPTIFEG